MGRIAEKKQQKREALLNSAYELFTSIGFTKTTIRDIAHKAEVAKGTFYLYFGDKDDIRSELIRSHASKLLIEACSSMEAHLAETSEHMDITDKFIYIIDYLIERVAEDRALLTLIGKHLTLGLFVKHEPKLPILGDKEHSEPAEVLNFETYIMNLVDAEGAKFRDIRLLFFTLIDLVNSTCYDVLMYNKPVTLEEYKPYLNSCIRALVSDAIITE